jgi:environmental stress-induced protein Ves
MQFNIIPPTRFKTLPWKNGKGSTKELLVEGNQNEAAFSWRLSMAPVTNDGSFSDFSGYHRNLILIEGNGIRLAHGNGQVDRLKQRFDMACFDGGWGTEARLYQGEITDFNVITREGVCAAQVDIFRQQSEHRLVVNADQLLIYALDTDVEVHPVDTSKRQLTATNLLQCVTPVEGSWMVVGGAVICIQISYQ